MNILWLLFTVLLSSFVQRSCAYGERGIPERGLYYLAYLAEEELYKLDKSTKMTVAPNCVGGGGGRCNFEELMLYIWAPKKEGMEKPTKFDNPKARQKVEDLPNLDATSAFNKFIGNIENARFDTEEQLNGEIDVKKLMPGKSDFYHSLSSMGDPIGALAVEIDKREKSNKPGEKKTFERSKKQDKVLRLGKETAIYISALRGKDQDKNRRSFLKKYFKENLPEEDAKKITIETMEVETPMDQKKQEEDKTKRKGKIPEYVPLTVPMIDFSKTIEENQKNLEGFKEKLEEANAAFMSKETTTKDGKVERYNEAHKKAFLASKMATSATGCTRKLPRDLKKRNPLAELSLRSPKAAKSMKAKARKLGLKM